MMLTSRSSVCSHTRLHASQPVGRAFMPVQAVAETRRARVEERHRRLRRKLSGTTERPRLAVFRSNEHIYAQIIDDTKSHTLATASTLTKDLKEAVKDIAATEAGAALVGKRIAELAKTHGIEKVAFDRGGFAYHGRVKALADAAREGGLVF
ncbi:hypothetical protein CEUSTIGMA_g6133.t1 [Chlamydomonas eustigma]|uniref:Large ribosomal subunit protein uL18c n=1 Tax=Chlamydomonas eustigma TaxID=1157962 RepID=A0A250X6J9_9CHLO|nr:hypothetical protein CEUSTIGMA_g6133.t1 [Chlamydomonas eustigma]|eukprot:GAX78695.1 hypothetical protein CEUSTIGMA_g6133.t1 [Chlamydomonas eustigma]